MAARDAWLASDPDERAGAGPHAMARCEDAVRELVGRLVGFGLPVAAPIMPCPDVDAAIAELEAVGPRVPPALRALWAGIGRLSLVDDEEYRHVGWWSERGVNFRRRAGEDGVDVTDGVVIEAPSSRPWLEYMVKQVAIQAEEGWPLGYVLSADGFHKDDISGGSPYLLVAGDDPWLARLTEFQWKGRRRPISAPPGDTPDLVSYLRSAVLESAGFPGLLGDPAFEPIRRDLVDGLPVF